MEGPGTGLEAGTALSLTYQSVVRRNLQVESSQTEGRPDCARAISSDSVQIPYKT
jgi:hypothetical protein